MEKFEQIAIDIDEGTDEGDRVRVTSALEEIEKALKNSPSETPILNYYRANAYAALRQTDPDFEKRQFEWQQPELSEEILSLRRAIRCEKFDALSKVRRCQIYTNLGNNLNNIGRPIEAVAAWDEALALEPNFAMAAANRASGIVRYGEGLYDPGHQCIFLQEAAKGFRIALGDAAVWDSLYPQSIPNGFQTRLEQIENYLCANCDLKTFEPFAFDLGESSYARELNQWRLNNRLFLNPLNDLGNWPVASQDIFHLPNHSYSINEDARFPRYYDLIVQEYVAACVFLFEGIAKDQTHPADKTLLTHEHGDYSVTSIELEKQKSAFRMAYSLLDKCAVFANDYFSLGHQTDSLKNTFRRVWFNKNNAKTLNPKLPTENWRLRGLYSLSLDIFDEQHKELASPLAIKTDKVRNAAEHRFLSIHEISKPEICLEAFEYVTEDEFYELTLSMLKLARAAVMGLSMAMHHQERYLNDKESHLTVSIPGVRKQRFE